TEGLDGVAHVAGRCTVVGLAAHGELPLGTALEVDAQVESPDREGQHGDQDERAREDQPPPRVRDELEVRALVVEVGGAVSPPLLRGRRGCGRHGHALTPSRSRGLTFAGASRPAAMPTPFIRTRWSRRARIDTSGCMKKYATNRSRMVEMARKSAKPRTDPIA